MNCKAFGHPASYRKCPSYLKYLDLKEKSKISSQHKKTQVQREVFGSLNFPNLVQPGKSFANCFDNSRKLTENHSVVQEFLKIARVLCEPETLSLEEKMERFIKEHKNMSMIEAKEQCLGLLNELKKSYDP